MTSILVIYLVVYYSQYTRTNQSLCPASLHIDYLGWCPVMLTEPKLIILLNEELLLVAIVLAASLATIVMVSNPAFAGTGFKNKQSVWNMLFIVLKLIEI